MQLRIRGTPPGGDSASGPPGPGTGGGGAETARERPASGTRLAVLLGVLTVVAVSAAVVASLLLPRPGSPQAPRASGIPANISTSLANLMGVSSLGRTPAPGFTLTDQHGTTMSLASLRGRVVVLEFMDPHCTDICPIVSAEFVDAYRDLGPLARRAVFVAVNVNPYYNSVADMAAYSNEHALSTVPSWHFLTGPVAALRATWQHYNITVEVPSRNADIVHTSVVYFIDAHGVERYLASPEVDHTAKGAAFLPPGQLTDWGRGIAALARDIMR